MKAWADYLDALHGGNVVPVASSKIFKTGWYADIVRAPRMETLLNPAKHEAAA